AELPDLVDRVIHEDPDLFDARGVRLDDGSRRRDVGNVPGRSGIKVDADRIRSQIANANCRLDIPDAADFDPQLLQPAAHERPSAFASSSTSERTITPVAPLARTGVDASANAGPAMSRCTHGVSPTNFSRNFAAVIAPPHRFPTFLQSATSEISCSLNDSSIGICQIASPALRVAASTS